jgi:hypothetical protein
VAAGGISALIAAGSVVAQATSTPRTPPGAGAPPVKGRGTGGDRRGGLEEGAAGGDGGCEGGEDILAEGRYAHIVSLLIRVSSVSPAAAL